MLEAPNVQQTQDEPSFLNDRGTFALGVRQDADHTSWCDTDGDYTALLFNADGELRVSIDSSLLPGLSSGTVASTPVQVSQDATADLIIASNPARKGFTVQNTGTTVIKLALGATSPTQTAYHIALSACIAADDGLGGYYSDDTFTGDVRAISSAGGGTLVYLEVS